MALESGDYIADLIQTNPTPTDVINEGDDHLRLIKKVLTQSFPNIDSPVTATPEDMNGGFVPVGGIIMWAGLLTALPSNFALCNGGNGTPNLQSRFIMASTGDAGLNPTGTSGGSDAANGDITIAEHELSAGESGGHTHGGFWYNGSAPEGNPNNTSESTTPGVIGAVKGTPGDAKGTNEVYIENASGPGLQSYTGSDPHGHEGSVVAGGAGTNNPLYYALAYIQRVA